MEGGRGRIEGREGGRRTRRKGEGENRGKRGRIERREGRRGTGRK